LPIHSIQHIVAQNKDTVLHEALSTLDTSKATSLFQNNLLHVKTSEPSLHLTNFDFAISGIIFLAFVLFVWLYAMNRKRLNQVIKAFYINRYANQLAREEVSIGNRVTIFLSTLFVVTFALFISQVANYYGFFIEVGPLWLFIKIATVIIATYGIKMLGVRVFGSIFQNQKDADDYAMTVFLFCNTLGLFMLPVVVGLAFARQIAPEIFIYSGYFIFGSFLCIRLLRGIIIGLNSIRISKFYLFLYLCTLEILPFVIMLKLFILKIK
jgi:hypothetical protein